MVEKISKTFCPLAWNHSFVNLGGEMQLCCTAEEFHEAILNNQGLPFRIQDKPGLNEVMNSDFMKSIRLEMLAGTFPKICQRCATTEHNGGNSRRLVELEKSRLLQDLSQLAQNTAPDGTIPLAISSADYRLGNVCNLECRMCHPASSAAWLKDWNEVKGTSEQLGPAAMAKYARYDWVDDDGVLEDLRMKVGALDNLHFAGGEPLFASRMSEMLKICIESGRADKIVLSYNTNMTRIPNPIKELWPAFAEVRLYCSVDGFGPVNDYIRLNSRWKVIDENLRMLDQEAEKLRISVMMLSTTVQVYNVLNLAELYDYTTTFKHMAKALNLISLYRPDYTQTQVLPMEAKEEAARRLRQAQAKAAGLVGPYHKYLLSGVDETINHMMSEDLTHLLPQLMEYTRKVDSRKGMRLQDYIPDVYHYLSKR